MDRLASLMINSLVLEMQEFLALDIVLISPNTDSPSVDASGI